VQALRGNPDFRDVPMPDADGRMIFDYRLFDAVPLADAP
jgi:hypothetical protein